MTFSRYKLDGPILKQKVMGVKCDAPGCSYVDEHVELNDYPRLLAKYCPLCGASLLTVDDMVAVWRMVLRIDRINRVGEMLPAWFLDLLKGKPKRYSVKMDGTGRTQTGLANLSDDLTYHRRTRLAAFMRSSGCWCDSCAAADYTKMLTGDDIR